MFATMRRKRRSAQMKHELSESLDHFKRAATIAAHETSATVGPKIHAAKDRVQPVATKARDSATSGWDTAVATLAPLVTAATDGARDAGRKTVKVSRRTAKKNQKQARQLEKRAAKALAKEKSSRRRGRLMKLAVVGAAVGAGTAYAMRRRSAKQWDEYDPGSPVAPVVGAEDAAFEPDTPTTPADRTA